MCIKQLSDVTMDTIEFLVMPFGLTNAPTTFQSCMNHIFRKQLCKSVLVFFDDILVFSRTWEEHLQHLDEVLSIMEEHSLFAKESKCEFRLIEILYLGHVIGADGVKEGTSGPRLATTEECVGFEGLPRSLLLLQEIR